MTPYEIRVLLHYYYSPEDHSDMGDNPPVWRPTIEQFQTQGLLRSQESATEACYVITERGTAYCRALQEVPLPEHEWVMRAPEGWKR